MPATRVLIVCDGSRFSFAPYDMVTERFTISDLVGALKANPALDVKTAHRKPADPLGGTPDILNFNFSSSVTLTDFDVLWLIGDEGIGSGDDGTAISEPELLAIAQFMDGGGGVFATGDHEGIGAQMCGRIPRVRTMRYWFWDAADIPADVPPGGLANWPAAGPTRADTIQPATGGGFYFDGQSDHIPQPLTAVVPGHPILQVPSGVLNRYPDHMHEGEVVVPWAANGTYSFFGSPSLAEYRMLGAMPPELPQVIATGTVLASHGTENSPGYTGTSGGTGGAPTVARPPLGILCTYEGWNAGVGRVVVDSSFHHLLDINLIGDPQGGDLSGMTDTDTHQGFRAVPSMLTDMHALFNNIVAWLARPVRALTFVVDKSTFGQDETQAHAMGAFDSALFVIVDGLTTEDFPGGPITETVDPAAPTASQLANLLLWAPAIPSPGTGITVTPIGLSSDDPLLLARLQRFTFVYRVTIDAATAFGFVGGFKVFNLTASLASVPPPPIAGAQIELIKLADPYFSNYDNGNTVGWLSSDLRVFNVIQGASPFGMVLGSTPADARAFIVNAVENMTSAVFNGLQTDEEISALSIFPQTTPPGSRPVFNFALARVRLNGVSLAANPARVFFRVFQAPTTASLTYQTDMSGEPILGYRQAEAGGVGGRKIALLGISGDGAEYTSMPCFAKTRQLNTSLMNNMTTQDDPQNAPGLTPDGTNQEFFYGAWLDTNQTSPGLFPATPIGQANTDGPFSGPLQPFSTSVMMGVHQCLGAEIVFDGAPIPPGSTPGNSDKLAQRNIAYTTVANPGTPSSRTATHTFEIRPSPVALDANHRPDELMIDWRNVPTGTTAALYLPAVSATDVVAMADKLYALHGLKALDAHTLETPVGGITYIPVPKGGATNFAGLFTMDIPLGIVKGQRFDVAVRQITSAGLQTTAKTATALAPVRPVPATRNERAAIQAAKAAAAKRASAAPSWRKVYGAFQIAVPVSTKDAMLVPEERTFSVMLWRAKSLSPNSRWYPVFRRYIEVLAARLSGLGGDPGSVPPTPDGVWHGLSVVAGTKGSGHGHHPHAEHSVTGKVDAMVFDHFGDFEAFVLETESGASHRYESREPRVLALVRRAWEERITTTVYTSPHHLHRPLEIVLHGASDD